MRFALLEDFLEIFGIKPSSRLPVLLVARANGLRPTAAQRKNVTYPTPVRGGRGRVTSYGDDRVCASPDCQTNLSRYNHSPLCWVHDRPPDD